MSARHIALVLGVVTLAVGALGYDLPPAAADARPAPFQPPAPVIRKLDNGLTVAVFGVPRLPIAQIQLMIPSGTGDDPPGAGGAARMAAEMLRQGTSSRSAEEFSSQLERMGASVAASANRDYTTIDGRFLSRDLDVGLELMSDAVINPLLSEEGLTRAKGSTYAALSRILRDPGNLADEQIWIAVFDNPRYGRPPYGTPESLRQLSAEQVRAFTYVHYQPAEATLAIAGDVDPERAFAAAQEWFGRWKAKSDPAPHPPTSVVSAGSKVKIRLVDAPGLGLTELRVALPAPPRGSSDELAFSLASARLGTGPTSRLAELREKGTLPREIRSAYVPVKEAGLFLCATSAANDSVGATVRLLQAELRRLVTTPPDDAELAPVRRTAANVFPIQFETLGGILGSWSGSQLYGVAASGEHFVERVNALTAAEVADVVRRWIRPEGITIVAIGPAAQIRAQLEPLGAVALAGPGGSESAPEPSIAEKAPTAAEVSRGRQIVKQAAVAHGGLQRLRGIKDSTVEADATLTMGGQIVQGQLIQIRKEPYRMIFTSSFGGFDAQQVLNGNQAWSISGPGATQQTLDSLGVAGMRSGFTADIPHLLLAASDPAAQVASRGREKIGDRSVDKVEVVKNGERRVLYFDVATHRLVAMDQHESRAQGVFSARRLYRDYRPVSGIPWPHAEERLMDGERIMTLDVKKVLLNSGVHDSIFERAEEPLETPSR